MRINEILVESTQIDEAGLIKTAAKGVGKAVGGVAKGIGAVAGSIAGIGSAVKKGFQAGKSTVAGDDDGTVTPAQAQSNIAATGNPVGAPSASQPATKTTKKPTSAYGKLSAAAGLSGEEPDNTTQPTSQQAKATSKQNISSKPAAASGNTPPSQQAAASPAAQSAYTQVKSNIDKLDKKGKQRILQALEKELGPVPTKTKPAAPSTSNAGPGSLGNLVQQQVATAKTKTATGGTVTTPKPGVTQHKANPNNPNLANA